VRVDTSRTFSGDRVGFGQEAGLVYIGLAAVVRVRQRAQRPASSFPAWVVVRAARQEASTRRVAGRAWIRGVVGEPRRGTYRLSHSHLAFFLRGV
jgi:hypothetical protein